MKVSKEQLLDLGLLVLRWYLAFYMASYGWSKLNGTQFGVYDSRILENPIAKIDKFYLAWHLFSLSKSFNIITGLLELLGAGLIAINRTALIGALFLLPVLGQIFIIDIAFTTNIFGYALPVRLLGMILADVAILYYHRTALISAVKILTGVKLLPLAYPWWLYPILVVTGFLTDFILALILLPVKMLLNWVSTL